MWVQTFHRFAARPAFMAACDAAGWTRGPDGKASPPAGVVLDVVGPAVGPPMLTGTLITPGAVDPRWNVGACWFSGTEMPPSFSTNEVIPERPVRVFAAGDPRQKLTSVSTVRGAEAGKAGHSAERPLHSSPDTHTIMGSGRIC